MTFVVAQSQLHSAHDLIMGKMTTTPVVFIFENKVLRHSDDVNCLNQERFFLCVCVCVSQWYVVSFHRKILVLDKMLDLHASCNCHEKDRPVGWENCGNV